MTIETMQWHEAVTLRHADDDYRRAGLVRLARRHVVGRRVLDLRCLTGRLAVELASKGHEVRALDAFAGAVAMTNAHARQQGVAPLASPWNLQGLPERVGRGGYDTVLCLDVLNHVQDDRQTLTEIAEVLADGGRLILAVPAFPRLLGPRDRTLGHLRRYTRAQLRRLLSEQGLVVEVMRYWNFLALPVYVVVEHVFRRRLSDWLRYGRGAGGWPNRLLGWWYRVVESRVRFPAGLTLFVIARKRVEARC